MLEAVAVYCYCSLNRSHHPRYEASWTSLSKGDPCGPVGFLKTTCKCRHYLTNLRACQDNYKVNSIKIITRKKTEVQVNLARIFINLNLLPPRVRDLLKQMFLTVQHPFDKTIVKKGLQVHHRISCQNKRSKMYQRTSSKLLQSCMCPYRTG